MFNLSLIWLIAEYFCKLVFDIANLDMNKHVKSDERFFRPAEVDILRGDPSKAKKELGLRINYALKESILMSIGKD